MKKQERKSFKLINKQEIANVYKDGQVLNCYPFRLIWIRRNDNAPLKTLFSVPKKIFKKAVDRNLIKRQVKEVFYNKVINSSLQEKRINLVITYIGNQKIDFKDLEIKMMRTFNKFNLKEQSDET